MLLAELEVWHTRPLRRPAAWPSATSSCRPIPPPGFGGLLLGAVVAAHIDDVDEDLVPDVHRLIGQVEAGSGSSSRACATASRSIVTASAGRCTNSSVRATS